MKKHLLIFSAILLATFVNVSASTSDLFSYDNEAVSMEMAELQQLEDFVVANPSTSLSVLVSEGSNLVTNLNLVTTSMFASSMLSGEPVLGIPSFVWGCVFGIAGIAVVYFIAEDSEETKKAFKGCVVGTLSYVVFYFVYAAIFITAATSAVSTI